MMKSTILKSVLLCSVLASLVSLPMLFAADGRGAPTESAVIESLADVATDTLVDVAMFVDEQGKLELAGVISARIDESGEATVELKRNGDFEVDPVLVLRVPVFEGPDGQLLAGGLQEITVGEKTVVLTIQQDLGGALRPRTGCIVVIPIPSGDPRCSGDCGLPSSVCKWIIIEVDDEAAAPSPQGVGRQPPGTNTEQVLTCACE